MKNPVTVDTAPNASIRNRLALAQACICCCYFCFTTSRIDQIRQWTDQGETGVCPKCGTDALLPGWYPLAELEAMHERWFTGSSEFDGDCES